LPHAVAARIAKVQGWVHLYYNSTMHGLCLPWNESQIGALWCTTVNCQRQLNDSQPIHTGLCINMRLDVSNESFGLLAS
jgi:hypothetical protein